MKSKKNLFAISLLSVGISLATAQAHAAEKLTIVTSFPQDLTQVFEDAFEKANPDIDLEILKKKTSSAIKYIKETSSNNQTDLFCHRHLMPLKYSKTASCSRSTK